MPRSTLTMGKDALISVLSNKVHPSALIREKWPNPVRGHRLNGKVIRQETKVIARRQQLALVFACEEVVGDEGEPLELHCVPHWCRIIEEGPSDFFFTAPVATEAPDEPIPMPAVALRIGESGRIDQLALNELADAVNIDDDNLPLPENIPTTGEADRDDIFGEWGHSGVCERRKLDAPNRNAQVKNFSSEVSPTVQQMFELFFPMTWVRDVLIPETNKHLDKPMTIGEFLRWIGMWLIMATTHFESRRDFWSTKTVDFFDGVSARLGEYMSRNRFEAILTALRYTKNTPPSYRDRFWEVREMIDEWNANMTANFSASWISCLDESMSKWVSEYTCPGWMCVPRKPWPLGNEYHSICCGLSGIMYLVELVEGKDEPPGRPDKEFNDLGKTVGLLLRLTLPLWHTSKTVVLDSGFCVLKGIIELRKKGVFAAALIKKRRYWPKHIRGDDIAAHFADKEVGSVDAWPGVYDNTPFHVVCLKEPNYVMSLMTTYGTLAAVGDDKPRSWVEAGQKRQKTIRYPEVIYNHFQYRDSVDANNSGRMHPIAIEETWKTTRWPNRVFQFLLATTEVNTNYALEKIYGQEKRSQIAFRRLLARNLIYNTYLEKEQASGTPRSSPRLLRTYHDLIQLPVYKTFRGANPVTCRTKYAQRLCSCKSH